MSSRRTPALASRTTMISSLLRAWKASVPTEEWQSSDQPTLRRSCAEQLRFGGRRRRNQTLLRVIAAPPGAESSYSVIELIIEDMPFLIDTLSMTLTQLGLSAQMIVHPILRLWRDGAGNVRSLEPEVDAARSAEGGVRESWQYWRIDRISDQADCELLRHRLLAALIDVRHACRDWMRMRNSVLKLCADIARHPPPLAADVIAESRALLQYMENHHFTFLGYRESRMTRGADGPVLLAVPETALGLLRRRLPGNRDQGVPASNIRRALRSRELLIITKGNHRSTVHRPGYLDYIGVKRFDARGRAIGEARILGLWASSAYHANPSEVPWLRLKLRRVIEQFRSLPTVTMRNV